MTKKDERVESVLGILFFRALEDRSVDAMIHS